MARDYSLNATVPAPGIPIGYIERNGERVPVFVSEEWRGLWFEKVGVSLFGEEGEDDVTQSLGTGGTVALGTGTSGDYVESISGDASKGVSVTGGSGEGSTPVVSLSQDLQASASPTFANVSVTGNVDGRDVSVDGSKLDTIATGATANSADATLLDRANHTGEQAIATVTGLQTALDGKVDTASITAITTDMSGDAFADELKAKINEIIAALA